MCRHNVQIEYFRITVMARPDIASPAGSLSQHRLLRVALENPFGLCG